MAKEARIAQLQEVVAELSTEVLRLKKAWGRLIGHHVAPQVTYQVVATVKYLQNRAGFPVVEYLTILGLSKATFYRMARRAWPCRTGSGWLPKGAF